MKKVSKIFIALLSCLTAVCFVLPVSAETEVEKKESVYAVLNSDGSVESITVSDSLHSDSGFNNYKDESNLKDIENLKSNDEINQSGTTLTWNTSDTDIYYQGTSDAELPLNVDITYSLDGKKMSAEQIVGQSGHLEINIKLTNNSKQKYVVDGKTYNLVTPFVTGIVGMFDDDVFKNVTIDNGKVTSDSSHNIVVGVVVPGLRSGLSQIFDASVMNKLNDYLVDEVTIEADVTEFESPTLMLAAATSSDALKDEFDDVDEFSSIFDKLDDLKEATQELIDGSNSLYEGASSLNSGVDKLIDGANSLSSGADQLSVGASKLESGLASAVSNNETLVNGVNTITDAVLNTVQTELRTQLNDESITLTWENYATVLSNGISDTVRNSTKSELRTSIEKVTGSLSNEKFQGILYLCAFNGCTTKEAITAYLTSDASKSALATANKVETAQSDAVSKLLGQTKDYSSISRIMNLAVYEGAISTIQTSYPSLSLTKAQAEALWLKKASGIEITQEVINQIVTDVTGDPKGINDTDVSTVITNMRSQGGYDDTVYAGLCNQLVSLGVSDATSQAVFLTVAGMYYNTATSLSVAFTGASGDIETATIISNAITKANADDDAKALVDGMINSLIKDGASEALTSLQGAAALRKGIKDYTDGIASAYDGSKSLSEGIKKLDSGASSLNSGVATLKEGATKLADGAKDLKEGMQKYNDEGISKLTDNSSISSLEEASELLKAICEDENNYNNYSGISDGTDGSIKFVFKVNSAKKAENKETTNETTTEKVSFWQRILNLFKF